MFFPAPTLTLNSAPIIQNMSLVEDQIVNGVTSKAPSQNIVYDSLAVKADLVDGKIPRDQISIGTAVIKTGNYNILSTDLSEIVFTPLAGDLNANLPLLTSNDNGWITKITNSVDGDQAYNVHVNTPGGYTFLHSGSDVETLEHGESITLRFKYPATFVAI